MSCLVGLWSGLWVCICIFDLGGSFFHLSTDGQGRSIQMHASKATMFTLELMTILRVEDTAGAI